MKRSYPQRGDNSPASKGPGGVIDKQFPVSGYENYSQCVEGLVNDLSLDCTSAENECATHFGGAETSSGAGKKTANRKTYPTMKTSKVIQVHSARKLAMEGIEYGQHLKSAEVEPEVPAWAETMIGGPPNLRSGSTNIRSAREKGDLMIRNYIMARQIGHRDDVNGNVEYNPD